MEVSPEPLVCRSYLGIERISLYYQLLAILEITERSKILLIVQMPERATASYLGRNRSAKG